MTKKARKVVAVYFLIFGLSIGELNIFNFINLDIGHMQWFFLGLSVWMIIMGLFQIFIASKTKS